MADVKDVDGRDRVQNMMVNLARGRLALGVATLAAPALSMKVIGMGGGADAGRDYMVRLFGAREIALGAGYLLADEPGRRMLARLGLVVDGLDLVSGLKTRGDVPLRATAGAAGVAGTATVLGAAKVVRDLLG